MDDKRKKLKGIKRTTAKIVMVLLFLAPLRVLAAVTEEPKPIEYSGNLYISSFYGAIGELIQINYSKPGGDGCYRQSQVETEINKFKILHRYKTWKESQYQYGECTEAEVSGGFSTQVTLPGAGQYVGEIRVNDWVTATYMLRVFKTHKTALEELRRDLKKFKETELVRAIVQIMKDPTTTKELHVDLASAVQPYLLSKETDVWYMIMDWLMSTPYLEVVRKLEPDLHKVKGESIRVSEYKEKVLLRISGKEGKR